MPHVESGKLIPLATTGLTRPAYLPNIPTVAESGFPGFEALNWYAFVAPGKTPAPLLERWNKEIVKVLNDPGVKDALNKHGLTPPAHHAGRAHGVHEEGIDPVGRHHQGAQAHGGLTSARSNPEACRTWKSSAPSPTGSWRPLQRAAVACSTLASVWISASGAR